MGLAILVGSFFLGGTVQLITMVLGILLVGYPLFIAGFKSITRFQFDEMALLLIAVVAAVAIDEAPEAMMVTLLFRLGNYLEAKAIGKSKREIAALTQIRPDTANVLDSKGNLTAVSAKTVTVGSLIQVKPGERVPLDCVVENGSAYIDTSALTGESIPVQAVMGSTILSGSINTDGLITCRTTKSFDNSAASRIIKMVSEAAAQKGNAERMISKFSKVYTPIVIVLALMLAILPPILGMGEFTMWLGRSLVFLVASCPCALVISVPLTFFAGVGRATKSGILIKGTKYIETLAKVDCVAFDKTGTLTHGTPQVDQIIPSSEYTKEQVIEYAAQAEQYSNHPAAKAIIALAPNLKPMNNPLVTETPGMGVELKLEDTTIHCGSALLMERNGIQMTGVAKGNIYVARNKKIIGVITLADALREDAKSAIARLHKAGVKTTAMLTGDQQAAAEKVAREVGVTTLYSQLLPEDKVARMAALKSAHTASVFVGDGINDAPVLAMSDAGIAMGLGTDTAIEAADIVLMKENLGAIADGIIISRKVVAKAKFNITFALVIKAIVLVLGALGYAEMWMAVFADVGVSILAILNAVSPIRLPKE